MEDAKRLSTLKKHDMWAKRISTVQKKLESLEHVRNERIKRIEKKQEYHNLLIAEKLRMQVLMRKLQIEEMKKANKSRLSRKNTLKSMKSKDDFDSLENIQAQLANLL